MAVVVDVAELDVVGPLFFWLPHSGSTPGLFKQPWRLANDAISQYTLQPSEVILNVPEEALQQDRIMAVLLPLASALQYETVWPLIGGVASEARKLPGIHPAGRLKLDGKPIVSDS